MKIKNFKIPDFTIVFIIVLCLFLVRFGIDVLNPTSTNWILSAYGDWGQHYLGWAYFREEPWSFPLGKIEHYNYPAGTTVGYTDSIPLMAYIFKTISFLLPEEFQYLGFWLLLSQVLTAFYTIKIIKYYTSNKLFTILVAVIVSFSPVMLYRDMHPALTAHWLIIGPIYYYIKIDGANYKNIFKKILLLNILAALINPYLLFVTIAITFFTLIKIKLFSKEVLLKELAVFFTINIFTVLFIWFLTGMISFGNDVNMEVANSYGMYSLNLNSFVNSESFSKFLPSLPKVSPQQYEGYSYLGLGLIILIGASLILFFSSLKDNLTRAKKFMPLVSIAVLMLLFAISNKISYNEKVVFEYYLPELFTKLGSVYRATGRFVWVFYYTIILLSFIVLIKANINKIVKYVLLIIIFSIQIYDVTGLFNKDLPTGKYKLEKFSESRWIKLTSNFERIITYQPFSNHLNGHMDYQDLCYIALKNKLPITIGYVARESTDINNRFKDSLDLQIKEGNFSNKDMFVVAPKEIGAFKSAIYQNLLECIKLDAYYILYPKNKKLAIRHFETLEEKKEVDEVKRNIKREFDYKEIAKPLSVENQIDFNVEEIFYLNDILQVDGWAFLKGSTHVKDSIFIALVSEKNSYLLNTTPKERNDLVQHYKDSTVLMTGFVCKNITSKFVPADYEIYIGLKSGGKTTFVNTNKKAVSIKKSNSVQKIITIPPISDEIVYNVEKAERNTRSYLIEGWAGLKQTDSYKNTINVVLIGKEKYILDVNYFKRPDVTGSYSKINNKNYDDSGFMAVFKKQNIIPGNYDIGIIVADQNGKKHMIISDKKIKIY